MITYRTEMMVGDTFISFFYSDLTNRTHIDRGPITGYVKAHQFQDWLKKC